jgi:hypothetical protein
MFADVRISSQTPIFQSSVPLTGNGFGTQRWGDNTSTTIDPTNGSLAWGVNEEIDNPTTPMVARGGTRFFNASIP